MGFKYDYEKKCYYVDGHDKPEQKFHRFEFTKEYLTKIELQSHRWVQFTLEEAIDLKKDKKIAEKLKGKYYYKCNKTGKKMVEYHVDDADYFHTYANEKYIYGGNLSERIDKTKKPIVLIGQGECTFHQ